MAASALALMCVVPHVMASEGIPVEAELAVLLQEIQTRHGGNARQRLLPVLSNHPRWAVGHFLVALSYHKEGMYGKARPRFVEALRYDPSLSEARRFYAWCVYHLGDMHEALGAFQAYLDENPENADALFGLALVHWDCGNINAASVFLSLASSAANKQGDENTSIKADIRLSDVLVQQGRLSAAHRMLERVVRRDPNSRFAWFRIARVLRRLDDSVRADRAMLIHDVLKHAEMFAAGDDVLEWSGEQLAAHIHERALLAMDSQKYMHAGVLLEFALQCAPDNSAYWCEYGLSLYNLARTTEARPILQRCVQDNPRESWPNRVMGMLYIENGDIDMAQEHFRQAMVTAQTDSDYVAAGLRMADALSPSQLTEQCAILEDLFRRTAGNPQVLNRLYGVYVRMGHRDKADEVLSMLTTSDSSNAQLTGGK